MRELHAHLFEEANVDNRRRVRQILIFLGVFVLPLLGGIHAYLWTRLAHTPELSAATQLAACATLTVLAILTVLAMVTRGHLPRVFRPLVWLGYVWMGTMWLLLVAVTATEFVRLGLWLTGTLVQPEQWLVVNRWLAATALGGGGLLSLIALANAQRLVVKRVEVKLARMPLSLNGFRLVQISDIHIGSLLKRRHAERIATKVNALSPDLLVLTGDLADGTVAALKHEVEPLRRINAKYGRFFITGNHEYYSDADSWISLLESFGFRCLRNERVTIGSPAASFELAGLDDAQGVMQPGHGPDLAKALDGFRLDQELVLLVHQPRLFHTYAPKGVGLMVSGHTHAGQIWPFHGLVKLQQKWVAGLYRYHGEALPNGLCPQLYVNAGSGFWGPPMRLGSVAEITEMILLSTAQS